MIASASRLYSAMAALHSALSSTSKQWETHATPRAGIRPQEALNCLLVQGCDILVGMFWTKLGTDTGVAESGTVEEINQFVAAGKPAILYFSKRPIDPDKIDPRQHQRPESSRLRPTRRHSWVASAALTNSAGLCSVTSCR